MGFNSGLKGLSRFSPKHPDKFPDISKWSLKRNKKFLLFEV
jgi:hypothetical protein